MSAITITHGPNKKFIKHTPGNTNWNLVSITGVPTGTPGVTVAMKSVATGGTADGALFYANFDQSSAPSDGFPVSGSGQTLVTTHNNNLYVKCTTSTDSVYLLFTW